MTTTERLRAGWYRIYDENGYRLADIRKHTAEWWAESTSRSWSITYTGGTSGGATKTLKEAVHRVNQRWDFEEDT